MKKWKKWNRSKTTVFTTVIAHTASASWHHFHPWITKNLDLEIQTFDRNPTKSWPPVSVVFSVDVGALWASTGVPFCHFVMIFLSAQCLWNRDGTQSVRSLGVSATIFARICCTSTTHSQFLLYLVFTKYSNTWIYLVSALIGLSTTDAIFISNTMIEIFVMLELFFLVTIVSLSDAQDQLYLLDPFRWSQVSCPLVTPMWIHSTTAYP